MRIYLINLILLMFFSSCNTHLYKHNFQPEDFFTGNLLPLARAIYDDDAKAVKNYIQNKGIDVNTVGEKHGYTLLLYAISAESKSVVKALLELGANPNLVSNTKVYENDDSDEYYIFDRYPLPDATYLPDLFFVKTLLKYGADPNLGNPLHEAIVNTPEDSTIKMFDLLLENGANINALNNNGDTPLYTSIFISRSDYANYFLDNGANANIICRDGETAAYRLQKYIDRREGDSKEAYIKKVQPTIDRFKARGIKFPVEKPKAPNSEEDTKQEKSNNQENQEQSNNLQQNEGRKKWSALFDDDDIVISG